jgi:hypothetical protein
MLKYKIMVLVAPQKKADYLMIVSFLYLHLNLHNAIVAQFMGQ